MSALRKWAWVIGGGIAAMALAFGGPMGCSDSDDDDDGAGTTTVVVTNEVTGVVTTNVVVVDDDDDVAPPADSGILNVEGTWIGNFQTDIGTGQLRVQLQQQAETIIGQFAMNTGGDDMTGNAAGSIDGDRLVVMLTVPSTGQWIELDGNVNAGSTDYQGHLTGDWGQGQFALQK